VKEARKREQRRYVRLGEEGGNRNAPDEGEGYEKAGEKAGEGDVKGHP